MDVSASVLTIALAPQGGLVAMGEAAVEITECLTCGYPVLRPGGHAGWCERVKAWKCWCGRPDGHASHHRKVRR